MEKEIVSHSSEETKKFAQQLAANLKGGEVIALKGDLGAGKTTFTQGLAKGLGIKERIQSPTFVLLKEHEVKSKKLKVKSLIHIDCYRLKSANDALSIGLTDYLSKRDTICVIEWAEKIKKILPKNTIYIKLEHIKENSRKIVIR